MLAFGAIAEDFDLDTWPDLFVANGHIWDLRTAENDHEYEMNPQLFRNVSGQKFQDDSQRAGEYFLKKWLGRSAARGDLDNDGTSDLVISQQLQPAAVLRNTSDVSGQSVTVRLIGRSAAREPQGVRLIVQLGENTFHYKLQSGGSFQSSSALQTIIATGSGDTPLTIDVVWSSLHMERWTNLKTSGSITLIESSKDHASRVTHDPR
jgi:hypothetical protein